MGAGKKDRRKLASGILRIAVEHDATGFATLACLLIEDVGARVMHLRFLVRARRGVGLSMSGSDRRARYGGPWFSAASGLPVGGGLGSPRRCARLLMASIARPGQALALVALLLRAPQVKVNLSEAPAGRALREHLDQRFLRVFPQNRACQGVLVLPQSPADYLHGRRRQSVRTNLRRAAAAGIQCDIAAYPAEALRAAAHCICHRHAPATRADLATLTDSLPALFHQPEMTVLVAHDRGGDPLAVLAAVIDNEFCLIKFAVSSSHEARWAIHHRLVITLIERGAKYLAVACDSPFGALGIGHNEQYYQHLLGYELCHVRPFTRRSASALTAPASGSGSSTSPRELGALLRRRP